MGLLNGLMINYKFVVYKDMVGQFRFQFVAPNGEIMATGEGYTRKESCLKAIQSIRQHVAAASLEDRS